MNTAMATWGGNQNPNKQAVTFEIENFARSVVAMTNDPSKMHETYRGYMTIADHNMHLMYLMLATEPSPTGICMSETMEFKPLEVYSSPNGKGKLVGYVKLEKMPMYNYPHQHQSFDGWHTHEIEVPNINLLDTADEVRKVSAPKALPVPSPAITPTDLYLMKLGPLVE
jgi:hypothetical protein